MSKLLEHDDDRSPGLPGTMPANERVLWRGKPQPGRLAISAFHVRKLAVYFGLLLVAYLLVELRGGAKLSASLAGVVGYGLLAAAVLGLIVLYARLAARATLYTVSSNRIVVRCGVALPVSINLPFKAIAAADLRAYEDGTGDIALSCCPGHRASYLLLWPYVRMRRLLRVQPLLRAVPEAAEVARVLGAALRAHSEAGVEVGPERAARPAAPDVADPGRGRPARSRWWTYPTAPLAGAAALVVITLVSVALLRLGGGAPRAEAPAPVTSMIELRFEDRADGSVAVFDASSGAHIATLAPGEDGFVRATLRSLANARRQAGVGAEAPFALVTTEDGRLLLRDSVTGRVIDLWAFGKTNAGAFARFFSLAGTEPRLLGDDSAGRRGRTEVTALALTRQEATP